MNTEEIREIEDIRCKLHKMFENDPYYGDIIFNITSRLWKLSHKKNNTGDFCSCGQVKHVGSYMCLECLEILQKQKE